MTVLRSREIVPMVKSQSPLKTLKRGGTIESSKTLEPSNLAASTPKALGFCSDSPVSLSGNVRRRSLRLASIQSGVHEITTPTPAVTVTSIVNQDAEKGKGKRKLASEGSLSLRSGKKIGKRTSSIEGSTCDDGDKSVHHVNNQRGVEISVVSNTVNLLEHVVGLNELDNDPTSDETGTAGIKATRRLSRVEKGKGKAANDDLLSNDNTVLDTAAHLPENVGLKELEKDPIADGNCNGKPRKRLTREEKGKRKVVEDGLLSNGIEALELNLETQAGDSEKNAVSGTRSLADGQDGSPVVETNMDNFPRARDYKERFRDIARQNASRFAHFSSEEVEENRVTNEAEGEMPGREGDREIEDWPGPFSTAMKIIKDREMNVNVPQQNSCLDERKPAPVMWAPKKDQHTDRSRLLIPPLQDLCIAILAKNADAITSLESVPDVLKHKLSQLLCDSRRMNSHFLDLLVRESPTEIRIRDCSWLTEEQLLSAFEGREVNNLTVLQLDQCGRCMPDYVLVAILARMSNILPALTTISLKGACRLSDVGLSALVGSAPALRSINLSQCSLLTSDGINTLADSLGYVLRELYIDDCQNIDTMLILPALSKLEHLEVLSLAGIQTVCDDFVIKFIEVRGHNIKELVLTDCGKLTDSSMKVIADTCTGLCVLDLGNLCRLTDSAMGYLANGCRAIQTLKLCRNSFSDEAVAAYLEASGESLIELSLNNVNKVSNNTAISLARRSRKLFTLDLSWCRNLTNEAVGLIVDSCLSLKVLKLFGCTQMASESTRKDPAWKYAHQLDPKNPNQFKCNFCGKVSNGGVYRVKQHLGGGSRNVTVCQKCPLDVREEIKEYMGNKKTQKDQMNLLPHFDEMNNDFEEDEDDIAYEIQRPRGSSGKALPSNQNSSFAGSKRLKKKGPMDVFYTPNPDFVVQNKKGKQTTIDHNDPYKKELRDRAVIRITRWMYDAGIAFNAVSYDSFGSMVEAIGQYGPGMKPPSFHEVRVPYLKKELNHTNELMRIHKEEWVKYGCSLMSDGWTSQNGRTLINFLVNCPRGTMFVESIDASSYSKDGQKLFELLDKFVDDVGEVNVVQIITDSALANVLAGKFLEAKRPHLFWTPCAAHCLDLILEDIFKLPHMKKTFDRAIRVHGYIYNRPGVLNMMRMFTQLKNLVKPAKTRFATAFLTLSKIHQQKNNLRKMFTSEEWTSSKWAKEPKGKQATQIMLMPSFWNLAVYPLKVSGPLVHVLRLVDSEKKPAMGYIYEAMDRAKESIAKSFNEKEEKYKNIFEIIDNRWNIQLHQPLHAAGHFLNPEFFYSNPSIEHDPEIMTGLYKCVSRLVRGTDIQDKITQEMSIYTKSEGLFAMPLAIRQRMTRAPADWWSAYGSSAPNLQKFAIKVLSLTCSAFGCERNWSVFEHITNVFLDGHSNPEVQIIGLKMTPILEHLKVPDPVEGLLRYSSVPS